MLKLIALNHDAPDEEEEDVPLSIRQEEQETKVVALYNKALLLQQNGKQAEAEKVYDEILKSDLIVQCPDPEELEVAEIKAHSGLLLKYNVYKNLANIAFGKEQHEKGLELYLEAAIIDETDVCLWTRIGEGALKVTNIRLARFAFEKGLNCSPNHWPCLTNLITVLYVIGDYSACLKWIANGLKRNEMFIKGLAIRDQIFKEEPNLKKDFYSYKELVSVQSRNDSHSEEYQKYIEEALFLREKRRLLSRREELPKVKFNRSMNYFSWSCLGECLLHLYDEVSDPDQNKSLCWPLDLEKYQRTPEQQNNLPLPSPDLNLKKAGKGGHKEGEEKRGVKRKKTSPNTSECIGEPIPKRRSARVKTTKPKEEGINWTEMLQAYIPAFLRSDGGVETEDSQDSLTEDQESSKQSVPVDDHKQLVDESRNVSNFINQVMKNCGCLDVMEKFLKSVAVHLETTWTSNLPTVYAKIYFKIRKQVWFPTPPVFGSKEVDFAYYAAVGKVVLLALECQLDQWLLARSKASLNLSPGQKVARSNNDSGAALPKIEGANEFREDSHYLLLLSTSKDVFQNLWLEVQVRFFWLQARFFMLQGDNAQAISYFESGIFALSPGQGLTEDKALVIKLNHCQLDNVINLETMQKKLEQLQRCQSLEEVNKLYETGSYRGVIELLTPLLRQTSPARKSVDVNVSSPERPSQLLLLQESLYKLKEFKKCLLCSEIALHEAVQQLTPCEAWTSTLERLFKCLNRLLRDHDQTLSLLSTDNTRRLIQNLMKVIESSMESLDANETSVATVLPWLILFRIVRFYDQGSSPGETSVISHKDADNSCSGDVAVSPPAYLRFLRMTHDHLGRRSFCCDNQGILLLQFVKTIYDGLLKPCSSTVKQELTQELEQCLYCLYGHPSKKTKNKWLQDHNSEQIHITWEYAYIVYGFFKPSGLPVLDNKIYTISVEVQNIFRRLVGVVPQKEVEVISFENLQAYIDGLKELEKVSDLEVTSKRTVVKDLFYFLGDFYFKNKEFSKAVKFYMHDVCLNPDRFESWAAMALARGSRLEEKIRACEPKTDGPVKKHIISTLRCFERAVHINNKNCMILEEYGSTAYMLNSHASRRLREQWQDEEFTPDTQATFLSRKTEMLELAESCFTQANECLRTNEGEAWLHSYMLGKTAEKLGEPADVYLEYYQKASKELHKAKASYPRRIPYHGAPEYSIEVLELYYRIHSSVLHIIEDSEEAVNFDKLEEHLERASQFPFVLSSLSKGHEKDSKVTSTPSRSGYASPTKRQTFSEKQGSTTNSRVLIPGESATKLVSLRVPSPLPSKPGMSTCVRALSFSPSSNQSTDATADDGGFPSTPSQTASQEATPRLETSGSIDPDQPPMNSEYIDNDAKMVLWSSDNESSRTSQPTVIVSDPTNAMLQSDDTSSVPLCIERKELLKDGENDEIEKFEKSTDDDGLTWCLGMQHSTTLETVKESAGGHLDSDSHNKIRNSRIAVAADGVEEKENQDEEMQNVDEESCKLQDVECPSVDAEAQDEGAQTMPISREQNREEGSGGLHGVEQSNQEPPRAKEEKQVISKIEVDMKKTTEPMDIVEQHQLSDLLDSIDDMEKGNKGDLTLPRETTDELKQVGKDSYIHCTAKDVKPGDVKLETKFHNDIERCKKIIDKCLKAFSYCLKRFPEHYKSQYKMAYIFAYYSTHKDLHWCRDLLLGGNTVRPIPLPIHGLFSDKKRNNLFQYLWRIPIDEIDRPGSFCSHICRAVELLLVVLSQLNEWDTLLVVSSFLHRTPDKDKKYLRDNDRAFLAIKAFDLSVMILKKRINQQEEANIESENLAVTKQLVLDCYEAYRHAQRMQTSASTTEHLLVRGFRILRPGQGKDLKQETDSDSDEVLLDKAIKFCVQHYELTKKTSTVTNSPYTSTGLPAGTIPQDGKTGNIFNQSIDSIISSELNKSGSDVDHPFSTDEINSTRKQTLPITSETIPMDSCMKAEVQSIILDQPTDNKDANSTTEKIPDDFNVQGCDTDVKADSHTDSPHASCSGQNQGSDKHVTAVEGHIPSFSEPHIDT